MKESVILQEEKICSEESFQELSARHDDVAKINIRICIAKKKKKMYEETK